MGFCLIFSRCNSPGYR